MIDQFDNERLKEPQSLRLLFKDMSSKLKVLKQEVETIESNINSPDDGLKMSIKEIKRDIDTLDRKITIMTEQQSETRKTVKNVSVSAVLTAIISGIIGFVMKQIGIF
ncbi:hypothetical protein L4I65_14245 [Staphylococcus aureus]|uniref:hypothetical protein n=1 Tax=Staphylococcus TaxID=1279 RepID=UPI001F3D5689|nr:hypothetical protein [Staphylococcus aureus]MCF7580348.1 hypothetical protein [Staphylococcus aureus]